jgi:hypothetical protein
LLDQGEQKFKKMKIFNNGLLLTVVSKYLSPELWESRMVSFAHCQWVNVLVLCGFGTGTIDLTFGSLGISSFYP